MSEKLQAIRGMEDVLPDASPLWEKLQDACRDTCRQYGYVFMRTPIVEEYVRTRYAAGAQSQSKPRRKTIAIQAVDP